MAFKSLKNWHLSRIMEKASPLEALLYTFSQVPDLEPPTNSSDRQFFFEKKEIFFLIFVLSFKPVL